MKNFNNMNETLKHINEIIDVKMNEGLNTLLKQMNEAINDINKNLKQMKTAIL